MFKAQKHIISTRKKDLKGSKCLVWLTTELFKDLKLKKDLIKSRNLAILPRMNGRGMQLAKVIKCNKNIL